MPKSAKYPNKTALESEFRTRLSELAIKTLQAAMTHPGVPWGVKVHAAVAALDRGWGKPDQIHQVDASSEFLEFLRQANERRQQAREDAASSAKIINAPMIEARPIKTNGNGHDH